MNELFHKFASQISKVTGSPTVFILALLLVMLWGTSGSSFQYSNTWQLFINTITTVVTFLMVFLIQNTQNRDSKATQLKLDELLKTSKGARHDLIDLEDLSDDELEKLHIEFQHIHEHYAKEMLKRGRKVEHHHHL